MLNTRQYSYIRCIIHNKYNLFTQQQMRVMQDDHHRGMEMLQRQLDHAEGELFRLQRNSQKSPLGAENDVVTEYIKDPRQTERPGAEVKTCLKIIRALLYYIFTSLTKLPKLEF